MAMNGTVQRCVMAVSIGTFVLVLAGFLKPAPESPKAEGQEAPIAVSAKIEEAARLGTIAYRLTEPGEIEAACDALPDARIAWSKSGHAPHASESAGTEATRLAAEFLRVLPP